MTHPKHFVYSGGQAGYAALFAILLFTAIFAIGLVNANLSNWQAESNLINRNAARATSHLKNFCQKTAADNSLTEVESTCTEQP